jgi:hypothetical protein
MSGNGARGPSRGIEMFLTSPRLEMFWFDRLPPELREALNYAPINGAVAPIAAALQQGIPPEVFLERIRRNLARFTLSFVKEE